MLCLQDLDPHPHRKSGFTQFAGSWAFSFFLKSFPKKQDLVNCVGGEGLWVYSWVGGSEFGGDKNHEIQARCSSSIQEAPFGKVPALWEGPCWNFPTWQNVHTESEYVQTFRQVFVRDDPTTTTTIFGFISRGPIFHFWGTSGWRAKWPFYTVEHQMRNHTKISHLMCAIKCRFGLASDANLRSWFLGSGFGQQLFNFQSPAVHWMARTSSLNCLSRRNPYQTSHSLNPSPLFTENPFFSLKSASSDPLPKNRLWKLVFGKLYGCGCVWAVPEFELDFGVYWGLLACIAASLAIPFAKKKIVRCEVKN